MQYCKKCLNPSTRPNIRFSENGLCYPCEVFVHPNQIDWEARAKNLDGIRAFANEHNQSGYDCIVGVSGGKDSTRQALFLRDELGFNPLLVSMNYPPQQISKRGVDNLSNLIAHGFDCINVSCSPQTWRRAMRHAFITYGNWAKSTEFALFASVPRMATAYQIPLIWWGESPANLLGEMGTMGSNAFDGNRLKYSNTLGGGDINWLLAAGFERKELLQYRYPSDDEMAQANIRIIFMDYFMGEFTAHSNGTYAALRGLSMKAADPTVEPDYFGTGMLDEEFININMYIRYLKFGFGRTSDIVNTEIRFGRMTRDEGVELVERFDGNYNPDLFEAFAEYIGISPAECWDVIDRFVNQDLFDKRGNGDYVRRFKVGVGL
jgi:N-acetyl sugar amidotransferase